MENVNEQTQTQIPDDSGHTRRCMFYSGEYPKHVRCQETATHRMYAPEGMFEEDIPSYYCRAHGEEIAAEYLEKLGETWPLVKLSRNKQRYKSIRVNGVSRSFHAVMRDAGPVLLHNTKPVWVVKYEYSKLGKERNWEAYYTAENNPEGKLPWVLDNKGIKPGCFKTLTEALDAAERFDIAAASMGSREGRAVSEAKSQAVRENGKRGGRPRKQEEDLDVFGD